MSGFLSSTTRKHLEREDVIGATRRVVDLSHAVAGSTCDSITRPVVSLKTLYTDFEVRELPAFYKDGAPLQLELENTEATAAVAAEPGRQKRSRDEVAVPEQKTADAATGPEESAGVTTSGATSAEQSSTVTNTLGPLVSSEDLAALLAGLASDAKSIPLPSVADKEKRGQLHAAIKVCLGATHVSNTVDGVVCVVKANAADRREERRRSRTHRPPPTYHHFTLYKENTDSNQALRMIAAHLRLSMRQLQFCGTKDKRAVTLQRVAIRETTVERLQSINSKSFGLHNVIKVSGFTQEEHGLRLGDANGNHFRIALRVFPGSSDETGDRVTAEFLAEVAQVVRRVGVVNYFGPQRFGTTAVLTSDVGVHFLRGDLREGLKAMLVSKATLVPEMQRAVELFESQDYAAALQAAPYYCYQERDVLKHLTTNPNDYLGALQSMPRTMAMMYFHAVQSLVWNKAASARLSGAERMRAEVGDLVLETTYQARMSGAEEGSTDMAVVSTAAEGEDSGAGASKMPAVRRLASEAECGRFALSDVLLPVPGPDEELVYPESAGCTAADYAALLGDLRIDLHSKESLSLLKIFHFHGTYRALGVRPKDFELSLHTAPSWRAPVIQSDWQLYCASHKAEAPAVAVAEEVAASDPQGEVQVIVAAFSLPPGSYATSVLREFCIPSTETFRGGQEVQEE